MKISLELLRKHAPTHATSTAAGTRIESNPENESKFICESDKENNNKRGRNDLNVSIEKTTTKEELCCDRYRCL